MSNRSSDANGNLTSAEGRTYEYDVENRLVRVREGSAEIRTFAYDGDGTLWKLSANGTAKTRYVTADCQVDATTGEPTVYYRFGGRAVGYANTGGLKYLLADHLQSTHAEVLPNQTEASQRRYFPFGSDRLVAGANDLAQDERYTGQRRVEAGGGNSRRELYHYGARAYLPGVGIFTQPDSIVPEPGNPQALNRYSYVYNNPLRYTDSSGHFPDVVSRWSYMIDNTSKLSSGIGNAVTALNPKLAADRAWRDYIGGQFVVRMDKVISSQAAGRGVDPVVLKAILRHESPAAERWILGYGGEFIQAMLQKEGTASIGSGQVQLRRARELEALGYVSPRANDPERALALLWPDTSVEYVAGMVDYLSDQLHTTFGGFSDLSIEEQQRLTLIGYNIGWEGDQGLKANIAKYGFRWVIDEFGYDDQTLDEYLRWQRTL